MQKVSTAWKENQNQQLTSEAFLEIEYNITDPSLPEVDKVEGDQPLIFPKLKVFNQEPNDFSLTPYATLEPGRWLLNGTMQTVPDKDYNYCGFVSKELCNDSGIFDSKIEIRIKFKEVIPSLPGFTITWDKVFGEYATEFTVQPYQKGINGAETPSKDESHKFGNADDKNSVFNIENTSHTVNWEMSNFNLLVFKIYGWSKPNRRARIGKLVIGINKTYRKENILKYSCTESIDPVCASLPKYEIQFELDNRDGTFNPVNPNGLTSSMMERQSVKTWYGFKLGETVERIPGGVYYLTEWSAPQNGLSATFKARDLLGFMDTTYFKGTFPDTNDGISLYCLAKRVLEEADLPRDWNDNPLWDIDESLKDIYTQSPYGCNWFRRRRIVCRVQ